VRSQRWRWLALGALVLPALTLAACVEHVEQDPADGGTRPQDFIFEPIGRYAVEVDRLWWPVFWIAVGVFVLVMGLLLYAILRYRERPDEDPPELPKQIHGNPRLEAIWTVIPAVILAVVAVPTVRTIFLLAEEPEDAFIIEVTAHQFWWEFEYPGIDGLVTANEMVMPTGTEVVLRMESTDVIHSFWVPKLTGKQDVVPGHTNTLRLHTDEEGEYLGQCAEFCGLSHANMRMRVLAVSPDEFEAWAAQQSQPQEHPLGDTERGQEVFAELCVECHQVRGHPDDGARRAPDLTYFADRGWFAGAIFRNDILDDAEAVREWIRDAPGKKPMESDRRPFTGMPTFAGLPDEDIDALVDYLRELASDDPIDRPDPVTP
jgi:cytochrome c oxidase subunit II